MNQQRLQQLYIGKICIKLESIFCSLPIMSADDHCMSLRLNWLDKLIWLTGNVDHFKSHLESGHLLFMLAFKRILGFYLKLIVKGSFIVTVLFL